MAIKVRIPNSGSVFATAACIPSSCDADVWLGFTTPISSSGSVAFFRTASEIAASTIALIVASPGQTIFLPYPFNSPSGIYAGCVSGGCAFAWVTR